MLAPLRPQETTPVPPAPEACDFAVTEALILSLPLVAALRFIPEQFEVLRQPTPEGVLEPAADGSLILMAPPAAKPARATAGC